MKCEYYNGTGEFDENWDRNITPCPECGDTGWIEEDGTIYIDTED
jgi:hypothetical protein